MVGEGKVPVNTGFFWGMYPMWDEGKVQVLEQGDSILVRVIASSSYREFELSGLYCISFYSKFLPNRRLTKRSEVT